MATGTREGTGGGAPPLPHPLYLVQALLGRDHYHFAWFERPDVALGDAQEEHARQVARRIAGRRRVLDVGCGMGGTSRLLARAGHDVVGIDPSAESIAFARAALPPGERVRFEACALLDLPVELRRPPFDAVVAIEVLQFLPPLPELFRWLEAIVAPGGVVLLADVVLTLDLPWSAAPFHRVGAFERAADGTAFDLIERVRATPFVRSSPGRILAALEAGRDALQQRFAAMRPRFAADFAELAQQLRVLRDAFDAGDTEYELCAYRRR